MEVRINYRTNLTDKQWQIIKKMIPQQKKGPKQICRRRSRKRRQSFIEEASQNAGREVFKAWLTQFECHDKVIVIDGKTYRFKMVSEKNFLTKLGCITVSRRIFQQDNGGPTYVPLDAAWEMAGEFATRDVRECVL